MFAKLSSHESDSGRAREERAKHVYGKYKIASNRISVKRRCFVHAWISRTYTYTKNHPIKSGFLFFTAAIVVVEVTLVCHCRLVLLDRLSLPGSFV